VQLVLTVAEMMLQMNLVLTSEGTIQVPDASIRPPKTCHQIIHIYQ
jgi:hypothetical protein